MFPKIRSLYISTKLNMAREQRPECFEFCQKVMFLFR